MLLKADEDGWKSPGVWEQKTVRRQVPHESRQCASRRARLTCAQRGAPGAALELNCCVEQRALPPLYRGWNGKEGDKIWSGIQSRPDDSTVRDVRLNTSVGWVNRAASR